jgi:hypothetical protein
MSVAKLAVIVAFEKRSHGVVLDGESINGGLGGLDIPPKEVLKAIFVYALSRSTTLHTTQASTLEREFPKVDQSGLVGTDRLKPMDHGQELVILLPQVGYDDHIPVLVLLAVLWKGRGLGCSGEKGRGKGLVLVMVHRPAHIAEEVLCLLLPLLAKQIIHIGRESVDDFHPHILAVFQNIAVCGHVIKVLRGSKLGDKFSR